MEKSVVIFFFLKTNKDFFTKKKLTPIQINHFIAVNKSRHFMCESQNDEKFSIYETRGLKKIAEFGNAINLKYVKKYAVSHDDSFIIVASLGTLQIFNLKKRKVIYDNKH